MDRLTIHITKPSRRTEARRKIGSLNIHVWFAALLVTKEHAVPCWDGVDAAKPVRFSAPD